MNDSAANGEHNKQHGKWSKTLLVCGYLTRLLTARATTQEEFLLFSQKRSKTYGI